MSHRPRVLVIHSGCATKLAGFTGRQLVSEELDEGADEEAAVAVVVLLGQLRCGREGAADVRSRREGMWDRARRARMLGFLHKRSKNPCASKPAARLDGLVLDVVRQPAALLAGVSGRPAARHALLGPRLALRAAGG